MKKIVLLTLVSTFLLSVMILTSSAQERVVGVDVGDWFKYGNIDVDWSSNDPNATVPEWLVGMNETEWMLLSVENVSSTNVTLQIAWHFKNGTDKIEGGYIDIDTGTSDNASLLVISANLKANDTLYAPEYSDDRINETVVRTYPDSIRETNHINATLEETGAEYYYCDSASYFWDRESGIVVEMSVEWINQTGDYLTTWSGWIRITESNVWVVPEFPTWTSMLLILIVLTVAITISKRRPLKTPTH